ncbi:hypothetical protein C2G38_2198535 [Gigaspora rosea]|uniref:Uncharacterized protein n=1 Tax=Gigaspora rosea TaxID=44941 RepID=A0A397V1J0_9GLOM|nr:hypothetical protein C2G38_2198535 [Gigaspora rosea]
MSLCVPMVHRRTIYNLEKLVPLEVKSKVNLEDIDKEKNKKKYKFDKVEKEEKEPSAIYWCKKQLDYKEESCIEYKKLFKGIEILKYLVNNLNKELGISKYTKETNVLRKEQQAKIEELMNISHIIYRKQVYITRNRTNNNYYKLNALTVKNSYPLLLIDDIFSSLYKSKWFSILIWQSVLANRDELAEPKKIVSVTKDGLYKFLSGSYI